MAPILTTTQALPLIHHFFLEKHQGAPLHNSLAFLCVSHLRLEHPSVELRPCKRSVGSASFSAVASAPQSDRAPQVCTNGDEKRAGLPVPKLQNARRNLKNRTRGGRAEQRNRKRQYQNTEKNNEEGHTLHVITSTQTYPCTCADVGMDYRRLLLVRYTMSRSSGRPSTHKTKMASFPENERHSCATFDPEARSKKRRKKRARQRERERAARTRRQAHLRMQARNKPPTSTKRRMNEMRYTKR